MLVWDHDFVCDCWVVMLCYLIVPFIFVYNVPLQELEAVLQILNFETLNLMTVNNPFNFLPEIARFYCHEAI